MSLRRLALLLALTGALLTASACSSDDDDDGAAGADEASADAGDAVTGDEQAAESAAATDDDDPENPWVLGYEVDGPAGTTAVVVSSLVAIDEEQPPVTATWSITDRPRWQLFSNWVESGELEIEVTEGGPATVTAIRARHIDMDDPFGGLEVDERLGSVEVTAGEPATLELP